MGSANVSGIMLKSWIFGRVPKGLLIKGPGYVKVNIKYMSICLSLSLSLFDKDFSFRQSRFIEQQKNDDVHSFPSMH